MRKYKAGLAVFHGFLMIETHQADVQNPYILSDCLMQYQAELQEV